MSQIPDLKFWIGSIETIKMCWIHLRIFFDDFSSWMALITTQHKTRKLRISICTIIKHIICIRLCCFSNDCRFHCGLKWEILGNILTLNIFSNILAKHAQKRNLASPTGYIDVGDEICWCLWDVGDGFNHFGHQHPLSFYISIGY